VDSGFGRSQLWGIRGLGVSGVRSRLERSPARPPVPHLSLAHQLLLTSRYPTVRAHARRTLRARRCRFRHPTLAVFDVARPRGVSMIELRTLRKRRNDARRRVGQSSPWLGQGKPVAKVCATAKAVATAATSSHAALVATAFAVANPSSIAYPAPSAISANFGLRDGALASSPAGLAASPPPFAPGFGRRDDAQPAGETPAFHKLARMAPSAGLSCYARLRARRAFADARFKSPSPCTETTQYPTPSLTLEIRPTFT
jgi:hypothetical protein